eukprot:02591_5
MASDSESTSALNTRLQKKCSLLSLIQEHLIVWRVFKCLRENEASEARTRQKYFDYRYSQQLILRSVREPRGGGDGFFLFFLV